jgi:putative transposase
MTRLARGYLADGPYHVTTRSAGPAPIYVDDIECTYFCNLVARTIKRWRWDCLSFCVMPTHHHLLLDTPAESLKVGMQYLNWSYARWFNQRHGRWGHVFGDRYACKPVLTDGHILSTMRYIARNPVRAGLCELPEDWAWSSYRGLVGLDDTFPFVEHEPIRAYFGPNDDDIHVQIRQMVSG